MAVDPDEQEQLGPTRSRPYASAGKKLAIITLVSLVLVTIAGFAYLFANHTSPTTGEPHRTAFRNDNGEKYKSPIELAVARPPQPKTAEPKDPPQQKSSGGGQRYTNTTTTGIADPQLSAPITAVNQNTIAGFLKARAVDMPAKLANTGNGDESDTGEDNALSRSLVKSRQPPASKAYVDKNYFYKIYPGTAIPLVRRTAINSQLPGFVMATIRDDIKNDDGFVLIPKDSKVFGQIKDGVIFGNDRIPILWTQIRTPDRPAVVIPISNPGADLLGRPGATGEVNNHIPDMIIATLTYTLIEAIPNVAVAALQNLNNNNSTNVNYNQFVNPGQSLGGRVLEKYMNIKPTLEAPPGVTELMIVGTEIDMSAAVEARYTGVSVR